MGEVTKKSELPLYMELQNWFKSQTKYRTKKELAEDIGINYKTLAHYFYEDRKPSDENRQKLYEVMGIKEEKEKQKTITKEETKQIKPDEVKPKEIKTIPTIKSEITDVQKIISNLDDKINGLSGICENCIANKFPYSKKESSVKERVEIVKELLYALNKELEFFKKDTPQSREIFRKSIHAPDIGYIIALLRALFDEDKFQDWLLMSSYEIKRR